jgi:hypothetical protein
LLGFVSDTFFTWPSRTTATSLRADEAAK